MIRYFDDTDTDTLDANFNKNHEVTKYLYMIHNVFLLSIKFYIKDIQLTDKWITSFCLK